MMLVRTAIVIGLLAPTLVAQDAALQSRVLTAIRAAMAPALPFPNSDAAGELPADGNTAALWMVRPLQPDDRTIEVIANPLNEANQLRATRAMAQIERNIEAAQRRATAQYDNAVAEAKRTGRSQEVDGVTLSDEGVAGAKIDAESHVVIDVLFNQPSYRFELVSGRMPNPSVELRGVVAGAVDVVTLPSNIYREQGTGIEQFREGETFVYLGRVARPVMTKRGDSQVYELTAAGTPSENAAAVSSLVLRFRGNEVLIADMVAKANWTALLELLK
jgi:hypothetical protein